MALENQSIARLKKKTWWEKKPDHVKKCQMQIWISDLPSPLSKLEFKSRWLLYKMNEIGGWATVKMLIWILYALYNFTYLLPQPFFYYALVKGSLIQIIAICLWFSCTFAFWGTLFRNPQNNLYVDFNERHLFAWYSAPILTIENSWEKSLYIMLTT